MDDLGHILHEVKKSRRVCASPGCSKALATLNRQPLCFCCHNRDLVTRSQIPAVTPQRKAGARLGLR